LVSLSAQSLKVLRDRVPLFEGFEDGELTLIMSQSRRRELSDGEVIIAEGTLATKLYIVVSGHATVSRCLAGHEETIATLKPGATVGEVGIVDRAPRSAKVVAAGATVILEIEHQVFDAAELMLMMKLYRNLAKILAGRIRGTNDMLDMVAQRRPNTYTNDGSLIPCLNDVSMSGVTAQGADFSGGDFRGSNFESASFEGTVMRNVSFRGADLSGAQFDDAYMIGGEEAPGGRPIAPHADASEESEEESEESEELGEPDSLAASLMRRKD
jgi:CRP-like cAMP-binding protein